jgi:lysophospholipase L1-like esterase
MATTNPVTSADRPSGVLEWLFHGLSVLGLLAIVALATELYVRAVADDGMNFDLEMWKYAIALKQISADPLIGHEHRPGRSAHLMGVDVAINSKKLRDREIGYERTFGTRRILMLGDSFTEGWGVRFEDTFSKRIERLYAQSGTAAEVINAGVGNYNTVQEAQYFLTEGHKYSPDIVVLNFTYNDAEPVPVYRDPMWLERHCRACVFLAGRLDTVSRMVAGGRPGWAEYYLGLYRDDAAPWRDAKAALHRLAEFCAARNIKLVIASFPELHDARQYRLNEITQAIRQVAQLENAEFVDLLAAVAHEDPPRLWVTPQDVHPNAYAHYLYADFLFQTLRKIAP